MFSKIYDVVKYNKIIFIIWFLFTVLGSLAGVLVDVFMSGKSYETLIKQLDSQVIYIVAISLIVAYLAEVITSIKLDGFDLGVEKEKKNYFHDQKIIILSIGILLLVFMLLAYAENTISYFFQIVYLFSTFFIGIVLFAIKYSDKTDELKETEEYDKEVNKSENAAKNDLGKVQWI